MARILLIPAVACALFLGCGKSGEGEAGASAAAKPGQPGAPTSTTSTDAVSGTPQAGTSSNPMTRFFTGLDRAAKRTGTPVPR